MTRYFFLAALISGKPVSFRLEEDTTTQRFTLLRGVGDMNGTLHYSHGVDSGSLFAHGRVDVDTRCAVFDATPRGGRCYVSAAIMSAVDAALASDAFVTEMPEGDRRISEDHLEAVWALQVAGKDAEALELHAAWNERADYLALNRRNALARRVDEAVAREQAWQAAYARGEKAYGTTICERLDAIPEPPAGHPAGMVLVGMRAVADMRASGAPEAVVATVEGILAADRARYAAHVARRAQSR